MSPSERRTLPDLMLEQDDAEPSSAVRPILPPSAVPWLVMTLDQLRDLPIDPRAGYVLSRVDGRCTVEMIIDICSLDPGEAVRILARLIHLGAIELHDG